MTFTSLMFLYTKILKLDENINVGDDGAFTIKNVGRYIK